MDMICGTRPAIKYHQMWMLHISTHWMAYYLEQHIKLRTVVSWKVKIWIQRVGHVPLLLRIQILSNSPREHCVLSLFVHCTFSFRILGFRVGAFETGLRLFILVL